MGRNDRIMEHEGKIKMIKLIQGDCLEKMKDLEDNSVDAVITDPPYELGFMGKKWDNTGIANNVEVWRECLRVLKPGGHLFAFGVQEHIIAWLSAIEDAGFEVRDMIEWVYGSGFPKSHNIGKAIDKLLGNEREKCRRKIQNARPNSEGRQKQFIIRKMEVFKICPKGTSEWEGWGTNLKPAFEPILHGTETNIRKDDS